MNSAPHKWKEAQRRHAWPLKPQGWSQRQIADARGLSEGAVRQGMTRAREGGPEALQARRHPGAARRLTAAQRAHRPVLWPRGCVAAIIRREFESGDPPVHVGCVLKARHWSPPKPARRARQGDEGAMARGRQQTWPALKKGRRPSRRPAASSTDRAFIPCPVSSAPLPRRASPRSCASGGPVTISRPSVRSPPEGKRYVHGQDRPRPSADVVALREHRLREGPGRLVIIWAGAPTHRRRVLPDCLAHGAAPRLHVERLPVYAPELNPGEGLWAHLKGVERRNVCCYSIRHLRRELRDAVKRVRRQPRIIQGCCNSAIR
jgi:transposase